MFRYPEQTEFDAADVMGGIVGLDNPPEVPKVSEGDIKYTRSTQD